MPHTAPMTAREPHRHDLRLLGRNVVIGLMAFLTVVDLFAAQAILPSLARAYGVGPAEMGLAVNACTFGMAVAAVAVSFLSARIDTRRGIVASLLVLALLTALLASAATLVQFALLRIGQGLCMAAAFSLTLGYLGEDRNAAGSASAFAAYVTGNVASNLFGRLAAAGVADSLGIAATFHVFAGLNLLGAALAAVTIHRMQPAAGAAVPAAAWATWRGHLMDARLACAFGVGFCILFAFIGTFTYVNFVLARPPFALGAMMLGTVYFVFLPSLLTTPLAAAVVARLGTPNGLRLALAIAGLGAVLLLSSSLPAVLAGLVLMGVGTFLAQAMATGYVGRAATRDRAAASAIYLASYFSGGLVASLILGRIFEHRGWVACVAGIAAALLAAAVLARGLRDDRALSP